MVGTFGHYQLFLALSTAAHFKMLSILGQTSSCTTWVVSGVYQQSQRSEYKSPSIILVLTTVSFKECLQNIH